MKVTSIEMQPQGSSDFCVLSFRDPRRLNPYNVKAITGLDADEIVPMFYGTATDGTKAKYYEMKPRQRDLVFRIELNPRFTDDESFSDLRDFLYKFISSSRTGYIDISFKNEDVVVAVLKGMILKFESSHFTKTPEVQLTVSCLDPILRAPEPVAFNLAGLDTANTVLVDDLSTAPHGMVLEVDVLADNDRFVIFNSAAPSIDGALQAFPIDGVSAGDKILLSSEHNDKYIRIKRGSTLIEIAETVYIGAIWPMIFPGENFYYLASPTKFSWASITHRPAYWGV